MNNNSSPGLSISSIILLIIILSALFFAGQSINSSSAHNNRIYNPQSKDVERKRGAKSRRVLLLIEETARVRPEANMIERTLSQKLTENDLSVTSILDVSEKDSSRLRQAIQKLQQGDKKAGNSIPFSIVVTGKISLTALEPFNGLYMAETVVLLKAIDTSSGNTIALDNLPHIRSYGNSQDQANKNALMDVSEKISDKFIKQISAAAR